MAHLKCRDGSQSEVRERRCELRSTTLQRGCGTCEEQKAQTVQRALSMILYSISCFLLQIDARLSVGARETAKDFARTMSMAT